MKRQIKLSPEFIEDMLNAMNNAEWGVGFTEAPHGKIEIDVMDENCRTVKRVTLTRCLRAAEDGVYHLEWEE